MDKVTVIQDFEKGKKACMSGRFSVSGGCKRGRGTQDDKDDVNCACIGMCHVTVSRKKQ